MPDWSGTNPDSMGYIFHSQKHGSLCGSKVQNAGWMERDLRSHTLPLKIRISPQYGYHNTGWVSWADWLGTVPGSMEHISHLRERENLYGRWDSRSSPSIVRGGGKRDPTIFRQIHTWSIKIMGGFQCPIGWGPNPVSGNQIGCLLNKHGSSCIH